MLFFRYTENPKKDLKRGFSFHADNVDMIEIELEYNPTLTKKEWKRNMEANGLRIAKNTKTGERRIALNGLCCFSLAANTLEEALEEIGEYPTFGRDMYGEETSWAIFEGTKAWGDCPDGSICHPRKIVYKKIIK
jgi:hypothetical protein